MSLPAGYSVRPATREDIDAIASVHNAYDVRVFGEADFRREHLEDDWGEPSFDGSRDTWLVHASDGRPAAFAQVRTEGPRAQDGFACVDPRDHGRGLGGFLLDEIERRARERSAPGGVLRTAIPVTDAAGAALARSRGFGLVRRFCHMERELGDLPLPDVPDGIEIRGLAWGAEDRAWFQVGQESFAGHFGFEPLTFEEWKRRIESWSTFSPGGVFLAWDGLEAVGMAEAYRAGEVGWIGELAVRRAWRGRGIGSALLLRGFEHLARLGLRQVRLNVDVDNETGAVRLYRRSGMRVRREWHVHEKALGR